MIKIPTLFKREFIKEGRRTVDIITHNEVTEGCEWVLEGEGVAYIKLDGTCCLIQDGKLYKRFDYKKGRKLPEGAIPCQEKADEITGHFPHWVKCDDKPDDKWHMKAFKDTRGLSDGTYELIGEHFNGNKQMVGGDLFIKHDSDVILIKNPPRTFNEIKRYLENSQMEGIVFHRGNGDMCKIKRSDFGFEW